MKAAMDDQSVAQRVLDHIAHGTTDVGQEVWREPVANYRSRERLAPEIARILRRSPAPFCPSAALPEAGSYVAREAAGSGRHADRRGARVRRQSPGEARRDAKFVGTTGAEDRAVVQAIQRGLGRGASDAFTFGKFESAIVHFHKTLTAALG